MSSQNPEIESVYIVADSEDLLASLTFPELRSALIKSRGTVSGGRLAEAKDLLEHLRPLGPEGKEQSWEQLVDGLKGLITA